MLKLFSSRYRCLRDSVDDNNGSSDSSRYDRSNNKILPKKNSSKNTKYLDQALKKQDLSQRYTRFPNLTRRKRDDVQLRIQTEQPTHQRLVIVACPKQKSGCHLHRESNRTMPKNKSNRGGMSNGNDVSRIRTGTDPNDLERSGSFMNKPTRGWLHPDNQISETGICYGVRYVGCLEVTTSMKSLDFDTRSQIAKECINRVCEAGGLKTVDKKRKVDKKIVRMLGDKPNMEFAGSNVNLTITSRSLNLTIMETGELIAEHEMPNVSFASGGDPDTLDFVAYVAKDHMYGRACFVLECGGGLAQDVITTIGQAFELRFKQYLSRGPAANDLTSRPETTTASSSSAQLPVTNDDPEYYNDLPDKIPPDVRLDMLPSAKHVTNKKQPTAENQEKTRGLPSCKKVDELKKLDDVNANLHKSSLSADNLIDLNQELFVTKKSEPEYVNCDVVAKNKNERPNGMTAGVGRTEMVYSSDPFDLQLFEESLPPSSNLAQPLSPVRNAHSSTLSNACAGSSAVSNLNDKVAQHKQELQKEIWFHGPISRKESEALVLENGDFLVRESQGSPGQYVLTGMQGGIKKHLLLVDPEGVVRTKDRTFESVSHLINYHSNNQLPIIAAESALVLSKPIKNK